MKKIILSIFLASMALWTLDAQVVLTEEGSNKVAEESVVVTNVDVANNDGTLFVTMDFDASALKLKSNHEVIFTPVLVAAEEDKYIELPAVTIAGRDRWYRYVRNEKDENALRNLYRLRKDMEPIQYQASVPFESWMALSELMVKDSRCGCMKKVYASEEATLAYIDFLPKVFNTDFIYIKPVVADKISKVQGSAYVDFPVNKTTINENYRNNRYELGKIYETINKLKDDKYVKEIKSIAFKGYASPEGPYKGNERLAKGRTDALIEHVRSLYNFPLNIMQSDSEAEDWEGLRKYVENSNISNRDGILAIIDMDELEPDKREWKLKSTYPEEYRDLLHNVYPGLRHSDYTIEYMVKEITDLEEATQLLKERPGILSPDEFYMIALSYEEGSEEYNEAFDIMVRVHSKDKTANLNAANVSMSRGDMVSAKKFLANAGEGPEVSYAKGVYAALAKDYEAARPLFEEALLAGIAEAEDALAQLDELEK